jgi:RHS repeat-associated protein
VGASKQAYGGAESSYRPSKWGDFREDYRFTGKEEDVEVGLTYFGKRFHNSALQRWVSPDPLEVHAVGSGEPNVYAYVGGRALQNTDPLGLADDGTQSFVGEGADANDATAQSFSTSADNAAPSNQSTFTPIPERTESDAAPVAAKKQDKYIPQNPLEGAAAGALTELASTGQAVTLGLSVPSEQGSEAGAVTAFPDATLNAVESLERLKTDKPLEGEASVATRLAYSVSKAIVTVATLSMGRRFGSLLADAKASIQAGKGAAKTASNALPRYDGPKPSYHVNEAHVPGRGMRASNAKTPLPADAEQVFKMAVPNSPTSPTAWFGKNADGQVYRYSLSGETAHFSGIRGVGDGTRNFTPYAAQRLGVEY